MKEIKEPVRCEKCRTWVSKGEKCPRCAKGEKPVELARENVKAKIEKAQSKGE